MRLIFLWLPLALLDKLSPVVAECLQLVFQVLLFFFLRGVARDICFGVDGIGMREDEDRTSGSSDAIADSKIRPQRLVIFGAVDLSNDKLVSAQPMVIRCVTRSGAVCVGQTRSIDKDNTFFKKRVVDTKVDVAHRWPRRWYALIFILTIKRIGEGLQMLQEVFGCRTSD